MTLVLLVNDLYLRLQVVLMYARLLYLCVHPLNHDLQPVDPLPCLVPLHHEALVHLALDCGLVTHKSIEHVVFPLDFLCEYHLVKLFELVRSLFFEKRPAIGLLHTGYLLCMLL